MAVFNARSVEVYEYLLCVEDFEKNYETSSREAFEAFPFPGSPELPSRLKNLAQRFKIATNLPPNILPLLKKITLFYHNFAQPILKTCRDVLDAVKKKDGALGTALAWSLKENMRTENEFYTRQFQEFSKNMTSIEQQLNSWN